MTREEYNAYQREWRRQHKGKSAEYQKRYYEKHPEKVDEHNKHRAQSRKEERAAYRATVVKVRTPEQQRKHEHYLEHKAEYIERARRQAENLTDEQREQKRSQISRSQKKLNERIKMAKEMGLI